MVGERTFGRHVQHVPRAKPAHREHRRVVCRFDRQPPVGGQRRNRLGFECRAAEELPERGLQQVVVQRAGSEDRRERHGFSIIIHGMARRTLLDFFADVFVSTREFVVYDDGYRAWTQTYSGIANASRLFAGRLRAAGVAPGDKVVIWSENRPEWIVALWGCLLEQIILVPIDHRASADFMLRVA